MISPRAHTLRNFVNRILFPSGFRIERNRRNYVSSLPLLTTHSQFLQYCSQEFSIKSVFDIGAHKGWWTQGAQFAFPDAQFVLIDPVKHDLVDLNMKQVTTFNVLLSDTTGAKIFYTLNETGDSYLPELAKIYRPEDQRQIDSITLNQFMERENLHQPDLIKIDTQGSELDIIRGGLPVFINSKVIICEVPLVEYNSGAPFLNEYLEMFNNLGFKACHILECHALNKELIQLDIAFIRSNLL